MLRCMRRLLRIAGFPRHFVRPRWPPLIWLTPGIALLLSMVIAFSYSPYGKLASPWSVGLEQAFASCSKSPHRKHKPTKHSYLKPTLILSTSRLDTILPSPTNRLIQWKLNSYMNKPRLFRDKRCGINLHYFTQPHPNTSASLLLE